MKDPNAISDASWRSFEKLLRTYVRSRVDPQWADDIVGNILMRLVQNSQALQSADNPSAYVKRVCINAVTDFYRRRAVERRALAEIEAEEEFAPGGDAPADNTAQVALSGCMVPFIEQLPGPYCAALTLTEIEQLTQKQAAESLGLSVSGLKSRVQRGRALLKDAITKCCAVEIDRRGGVMDFERRSDDCGSGC